VALFYEDGRPIDGKGVGRKVLDKVHETYKSELDGKEFAYDGEKSLFTVGALPRNKLEFTVVLDSMNSTRNNGNASPDNDTDKKRMRRSYQSKTFKVELSFAAKIPMQSIAQALRGQESENSQEALRVLDIILRQHAAKQGCLLVRQSFFHNDVKNFADVGGGVLGCRGFHSSFRTSQGGLSLNIDVSTTMIIQPGPVVDFLIANQNVKDPYSIDWTKLKVGNGEDFFPRNGRWNFNNKKIDEPFDVFEENPQNRRAPPVVRVEKMFDFIQSKLPGAPQFLLCLLPERKNSDLYGPWKKKCLSEFGIVTQCIAPMRVNDQYLTNVLLKINAKVKALPHMCTIKRGKTNLFKLGGLNSMLAVEHSPSIPIVSKSPTLILGMDVSHGQPGQSDVPSIAAVVSSRHWPLISRYRASVRTQSPKLEMVDSLFNKVSDTVDEGIMKEVLLDFYVSSAKRKPDQIIIFRDGVSESQFNQVLNIELDQIIEACKFLDDKWCPKFLVIIAQKNHHTKFFQPGSPDNVPPGTVIDNKVCHPRNNDFYMCAHAGMIGTTRPTHYHVLYDEIGFSADDLQELVHSLSYVYQRSTTAISVVAPICYAHLAATQMSQFMKFEDRSETSSSHGGTGVTSAAAVPVQQLPKLQENVCNSMFFC
ncbi:hypothetical protein M8C21_025609, partial [Ambrosia artemisiifolia]